MQKLKENIFVNHQRRMKLRKKSIDIKQKEFRISIAKYKEVRET